MVERRALASQRRLLMRGRRRDAGRRGPPRSLSHSSTAATACSRKPWIETIFSKPLTWKTSQTLRTTPSGEHTANDTFRFQRFLAVMSAARSPRC